MPFHNHMGNRHDYNQFDSVLYIYIGDHLKACMQDYSHTQTHNFQLIYHNTHMLDIDYHLIYNHVHKYDYIGNWSNSVVDILFLKCL